MLFEGLRSRVSVSIPLIKSELSTARKLLAGGGGSIVFWDRDRDGCYFGGKIDVEIYAIHFIIGWHLRRL